jgi:hypothetical protein
LMHKHCTSNLVRFVRSLARLLWVRTGGLMKVSVLLGWKTCSETRSNEFIPMLSQKVRSLCDRMRRIHGRYSVAHLLARSILIRTNWRSQRGSVARLLARLVQVQMPTRRNKWKPNNVERTTLLFQTPPL